MAVTQQECDEKYPLSQEPVPLVEYPREYREKLSSESASEPSIHGQLPDDEYEPEAISEDNVHQQENDIQSLLDEEDWEGEEEDNEHEPEDNANHEIQDEEEHWEEGEEEDREDLEENDEEINYAGMVCHE